jgi:hypothetical protein
MARRKSSIADDLVLLPWWVSVILAFLVYSVLPGFLPPAIAKAGVTSIVAVGLLVIAAVSALRSWRNRRMLEAQTGICWAKRIGAGDLRSTRRLDAARMAAWIWFSAGMAT